MSIEFEGEPEKTEIDIGVLRELSRTTYTNPISCFREMTANAADQYEKTDETGNALFTDAQKIIDIKIDQLRRKIICTDYATGIEEGKMREFKKVGTEDTKGITGKTVGFAKSSYTNIHDTIQGQKRIGKLSFSEASETSDVWYYSNNGLNGKILRYKDFQWYGPIDRDTTKVLENVGLRVEINDAKPEVRNEKVVRNALTKWFGLRIAHGKMKIILQDIPITKGDLKTDGEETIDYLSNGTKIRARLMAANAPKYQNIDLYCKSIYVKSIHVEFLAEGYVDCKDLEIGAGRNEFMESQDTHYPEFYALLMKHLADNFDRPGVNKEKNMEHRKLKEDICATGIQVFAELYPELARLVEGIPMIGGMKGKGKAINGENNVEKNKTETIKGVDVIREGGATGGDIWIYGDKPREETTNTKNPVTEERGQGGNRIEPGGKYTAVKKIPTKESESINVRPNVVVSEIRRENARGSLIELAAGRIRVVFNTQHAATRKNLHTDKKEKVTRERLKLGVSSLFVRAMVDHVTTLKPEMTTASYSEMYDNLFDAMMDAPVS